MFVTSLLKLLIQLQSIIDAVKSIYVERARGCTSTNMQLLLLPSWQSPLSLDFRGS